MYKQWLYWHISMSGGHMDIFKKDSTLGVFRNKYNLFSAEEYCVTNLV